MILGIVAYVLMFIFQLWMVIDVFKGTLLNTVGANIVGICFGMNMGVVMGMMLARREAQDGEFPEKYKPRT